MVGIIGFTALRVVQSQDDASPIANTAPAINSAATISSVKDLDTVTIKLDSAALDDSSLDSFDKAFDF